MKIILRIFLIILVSVGFSTFGCEPESTKCKKTEDCKTAGQICSGGLCVANTENPSGDGGNKEKKPKKPCKQDKDCANTELCKANFCASIPAKCTGDSDCRKGSTCDKTSGKCIKTCAFDEDCPKDQACDTKKKQCVTVKKCKETKDCAKGQACNTCRGLCVPSVGQRCAEAFNCTDLNGADNAWCDKCVKECKKRLDTCQPCTKNEQCGQEGDLCIPDLLNPQSGKKFCGKACSSGLCPPSYKCKTFKGDAFKSSPAQCIPASNNCSSPGECKSNADCRAQGKICDTQKGQCVAGCSVDQNCPVKKTAEKCTKNGDCKNAAAVCTGGICTIQLKCCRGRCGSPCQVSSECEAQEQCTDGCCKFDGECKSSKDCKDKEYCNVETGLCTPGCKVPDDCGQSDPQKPRCRWKCQANQCVEDCTCRSPSLDCPAIRFCPTKEAQKKDPLAPCRKPKGPACKPCKGNTECGCKPGDDCLVACTKVECKSDAECKGNGKATTCYNGRCSTKKGCRNDSECPKGEKCENKFCAENCGNVCLNLQSGARCAMGCDPLGDGSECPSRMPCTELTPQKGSGPKCKIINTRCTKDSDCSGKRCGGDGYCTECKAGKVCRNLNPKDSTDFICIKLPPYVCMPNACKDGGF